MTTSNTRAQEVFYANFVRYGVASSLSLLHRQLTLAGSQVVEPHRIEQVVKGATTGVHAAARERGSCRCRTVSD